VLSVESPSSQFHGFFIHSPTTPHLPFHKFLHHDIQELRTVETVASAFLRLTVLGHSPNKKRPCALPKKIQPVCDRTPTALLLTHKSTDSITLTSFSYTELMDSFFDTVRLGPSGTPTTKPLQSWGFDTLDQTADPAATSSVAPTPAPPSLFGDGTAPIVASSSSSTQGPQGQLQPQNPPPRDLVFAAVSTDATGKQTTKKILDPTTILNGDVQILRIYLSLSHLPPQCLDEMHAYFQQHNVSPILEIHLCVRSLLRPCLQDIAEDSALEQAMTSMVANWAAVTTTFKFFFLRPGVPTDRDRFQNFVEKDLVRAIEGLKEHDVELSEILGEESCLYGQPAEAVGVSDAAVYDLVEEMI
jgi:hypothetical protein